MNFDNVTIKVYGTQRRKEKYIEISPKKYFYKISNTRNSLKKQKD